MEISLATSISAPRFPRPVALDLNFAEQTYRRDGASVSLASVMSFTRATPARVIDASGLAQMAAADVPRLDHDLSGKPRGLFVEGASSNVVVPSNMATGWGASGCTNTDASPAPDGSDARLITVNTGATDCFITGSASVTLGAPHTVSVYCRRDQNRYAILYGFGNGTGGVGFDLQAGTAQVNTAWLHAEIEILNAQVARIVGTLTPTTNGVLAIAPTTNMSGSKSFSGGEMLTLWGAQCEAGSAVSSQIPALSSVTARAADAPGLLGVSGTHDVKIVYDDDSETQLTGQTLTAGWWPPALARPHVKRLVVT